MASVTADLCHDSINNQKTNTSSIFLTKCDSINSYNSSEFCGSKRDGYKKIRWLNGEYFEGFFINGKRFKVGIHKWGDGDEYIGEYFDDKRHGWGRYRWFNDDIYEGTFYNDQRHGYGTYLCSNGDKFTGTFWMNQRDGFGTLTYANGNVFEGLYKENYRCGPGIMYYKDGRHDLGLWYRNSIFKLLFQLQDVFSLNQFQMLNDAYKYSQYNDYDSDGEFNENTRDLSSQLDRRNEELGKVYKYKLIKPSELSIFSESDINSEMDKENQETMDVKMEEAVKNDEVELENEAVETEILIDQIADLVDKEDIESTSKYSNPSEVEVVPITVAEIEEQPATDSHILEERKEYVEYNEEFIQYVSSLKIPSNITPVMKKIINHINLNASNFPKESPTTIPTTEVTHIISLQQVFHDVLSSIFESQSPKINVRQKKYGPSGDNELKSEQLLSLCHYGEIQSVEQLFLSDIPPNINVTDSKGSFSLLEATLTWDTNLINYLLDKGANINQTTDEGVSALGGCLLYYYPQKNFIFTIAEDSISLSMTPLNFNGVRREFTSQPLAMPNKEEKQILDPIKEEPKETINEEWNSYQDFLIEDIISNGELTVVNTDTELKPIQLVKQMPMNSNTSSNEFVSNRNCVEYPMTVKDKLLQKAASSFSVNEKLVRRQTRPSSCNQEISDDEGKARYLAMKIARVQKMLETIELLLNRGANPNVCLVPFPSLFFTIKSGDIQLTKLLIDKGANVNSRLTVQNYSLTPLHIAVCLPGNNGLNLTKILLAAGANPNIRSAEDISFLDSALTNEWNEDEITDEQKELLGGRTPLHLVCARYDNTKTSHKICKLLLDYEANPNLICNGYTPLTLAIATGNDLIVNELLSRDQVEVNLSLTHGMGNALCVASSTAFEHTRPIESRLTLMRRLIDGGGKLLAPVTFGMKRLQGTAVDYAHNIFNMDQRVAHLPYHALTTVERELFNNRRSILSHLGMFIREEAVEKEKERLESFKFEGIQSRGPSPDFVYTGAGADPADIIRSKSSGSTKQSTSVDAIMQGSELLARKPMFKYCYDCGRSTNVKLTPCTRCKEVFFCSKLCKTKAWSTRHKFECLRIGGRPSSVGLKSVDNKKADSPTPATVLEDVSTPNATKTNKLELLKSQNMNTSPQKTNTEAHYKSKAKISQKKLPPLQTLDHPGYSYSFINGYYRKIDKFGNLLPMEEFFDNYSFQ